MSPFESGPSRFYPAPPPPHHAPSGNPPVTRPVRGYGVSEGFMWPAWLKSSPKVEVVLLLQLLRMEVTTKPAEENVRCCGIVFPQELNRTWSKKHRSAGVQEAAEKPPAHSRRWNPPSENSFESYIHKYPLID